MHLSLSACRPPPMTYLAAFFHLLMGNESMLSICLLLQQHFHCNKEEGGCHTPGKPSSNIFVHFSTVCMLDRDHEYPYPLVIYRGIEHSFCSNCVESGCPPVPFSIISPFPPHHILPSQGSK